MKSFIFTCILIVISMGQVVNATGSKEAPLTPVVREGLQSGRYTVLLRHALAPGTGDPDNFNVSDCSTQRNLSPQGRRQAQLIGELLKNNGIEQAAVFSSQWCRCLETGQLLDLGEVTELPMINSFFGNYEREPEQTLQVKEWLVNQRKDLPLPVILVTHQVNITALTGIFPRSGGLVVIDVNEDGNIAVVAQLETDD